jgi:hypothetical protein
MKKFREGHYTKENIELIMQLFAEANADLGLLRLPSQYEATMPYVKTMFFKKMTEKLEEINQMKKQEEEEMLDIFGKKVKFESNLLNENSLDLMAEKIENKSKSSALK